MLHEVFSLAVYIWINIFPINIQVNILTGWENQWKNIHNENQGLLEIVSMAKVLYFYCDLTLSQAS